MEIYPDNLGPEVSAAVQKERSLRPTVHTDTPFGIVIGFIGFAVLATCVFVWLLNLIVSGNGWGWLGAMVSIPLLFFLWQALMSGSMTWKIPNQSLTVLTPAEAKLLAALQEDVLLHRYLDLVSDTLQTDVPDPDAQQEIRAALQALGTTVVSLPAEEPRTVTDDPAALHSEAARLSAEADAEPDAVIGASLRRRAESLTRRADTAAKTLLLLRRNQALRQETAEQMEALQTSLTAFRVGGQPSVPELADLAASIQRVAREASAITDARAEVGTLLAAPGRVREDTAESQRQSVSG